jgi:hypothetical protein
VLFRRGIVAGWVALILLSVGCGGGEPAPQVEAARVSAAAQSTEAVPRRCPQLAREALPLGERARQRAESVVLRRENPSYRPEAQAVATAHAGPRGRSAGYYCGDRIAGRTLVVFVQRRAFDRGPDMSASLAEGVFLVSRLPGGYRVWVTLHG